MGLLSQRLRLYTDFFPFSTPPGELSAYVDSLYLIFENDIYRYGHDLPSTEAFPPCVSGSASQTEWPKRSCHPLRALSTACITQFCVDSVSPFPQAEQPRAHHGRERAPPVCAAVLPHALPALAHPDYAHERRAYTGRH